MRVCRATEKQSPRVGKLGSPPGSAPDLRPVLGRSERVWSLHTRGDGSTLDLRPPQPGLCRSVWGVQGQLVPISTGLHPPARLEGLPNPRFLTIVGAKGGTWRAQNLLVDTGPSRVPDSCLERSGPPGKGSRVWDALSRPMSYGDMQAGGCKARGPPGDNESGTWGL